MANYAVDYSYKVEEFNVINVEADSMAHAEEVALDLIRTEYPDLNNVEIEGVLEIK